MPAESPIKSQLPDGPVEITLEAPDIMLKKRYKLSLFLFKCEKHLTVHQTGKQKGRFFVTFGATLHLPIRFNNIFLQYELENNAFECNSYCKNAILLLNRTGGFVTCRKKKGFDIEAWFRRKFNRIERETQLNLHKVNRNQTEG